MVVFREQYSSGDCASFPAVNTFQSQASKAAIHLSPSIYTTAVDLHFNNKSLAYVKTVVFLCWMFVVNQELKAFKKNLNTLQI